MSHPALVTAARDRIRNVLGYKDTECGRTPPGGQPPPRMGEWYAGVWAGAWQNGKAGGSGQALDGLYDLIVTLTWRCSRVPYDRVGDQMCAEGGFWDRVRAIALLLGKDRYDFHVGRAINVLLTDPLTGDEPTGFREGLLFFSGSEPRWVAGPWFHAAPEAVEVGLVTDLRFGRARRLENLANVTE